MPMIEMTCPENSFSKEDQDQLMHNLTDCLLRWEGAPVDNAVAQSISWAFLYEQPRSQFYVGGLPISQDHYRVNITVPEGVLDEDRKAGLVAEATELVGKYAGAGFDSFRTWVLVHEIAEGNWGGAGQIFRRRDIVKRVYSK